MTRIPDECKLEYKILAISFVYRRIGINDDEIYDQIEWINDYEDRLNEIKQSNNGAYKVLLAHLDAYDRWFKFYNSATFLDIGDDELRKLMDDRDSSRSALLRYDLTH